MRKRNQKNPEGLALFCAQCSLVLRAGMLLSEGLFAAAEESGDEGLHKIAQRLNDGGTLELALGESGGYPPYLVSLVGIGERTGRLEQVLDALSDYYQREQSIRRQLKNTLFYPLLLALVMLAIVAVLLIRVLPVFAEVYAQIGGAGGLSSGVLRFGRTAGMICLGVTGLFALLGIAAYASSRTTAGYARMGAILARLPFAKKLADRISSGRVAYALSLLLSSGYDIDDSLKLLPGLLAQPAAVQKVAKISAAMERGATFAAASAESGLFSGMYARLVSLGAQSGSLDTVMARLATMYDGEIEEGLYNLMGAAEPAIVALLSGVIGVILLSVMTPLLEILSAF